MFHSHAMLPGSQESREFCLPGGHPTWDEGTGAKEEKVSAGYGPGQEAGHGATGMGWRSRPLGSEGLSGKGDTTLTGRSSGRLTSPAQRRPGAGRGAQSSHSESRAQKTPLSLPATPMGTESLQVKGQSAGP